MTWPKNEISPLCSMCVLPLYLGTQGWTSVVFLKKGWCCNHFIQGRTGTLKLSWAFFTQTSSSPCHTDGAGIGGGGAIKVRWWHSCFCLMGCSNGPLTLVQRLNPRVNGAGHCPWVSVCKLLSTLSLILWVRQNACSDDINTKTVIVEESSSSSCTLDPGATPRLNQTECFQSVRMRLTWTISCCVLHGWKGESWQCPDLIL